MADVSHPHSPDDIVHYNVNVRDEHTKRRGSFGMTALSIILIAAIGFLAFKLRQENARAADTAALLTRANSELSVVRADLTGANANVANLQAQLEQAKRQQTELQAQMKKSEESGAGLQTQFDQSRTEMKALSDKAQSQITELQAQLAQANDGATAARKELATAKTQIDDLKAQVEKAKTAEVPAVTQPAVTAQPIELPIATEFKKALFRSTYTLQIKNQGTEPLKLDINVTGSDKTPSQNTTVAAGETFKMEGLAAGANVVIASAGFQSVTLTAQ